MGPCTPVLLTVCRRRSPPWLPPPSRSRSSLPPRGSTPSGSEAPSWPPSPPSSRRGSPSRSTTSAAPPSCTGSASKCNHPVFGCSINVTFQTIHCYLLSTDHKYKYKAKKKKKKKNLPVCTPVFKKKKKKKKKS